MISEILQHWNQIFFVWIFKSQLLCDYSLGPPTGRPLTTPYPMTTSRPTTPAPRPRITPAPTPRPTPRPEIPEFCNVQIQAAVRGEISFVFSYKLLDSNKQKYISLVLNFKSLLLQKNLVLYIAKVLDVILFYHFIIFILQILMVHCLCSSKAITSWE